MQVFGDYERSEGATFKGPLLPHGATAQEQLAKQMDWTRAKAVRRAVRAFLQHLAADPGMLVVASSKRGALPDAAGRYDTGLEAETTEAVDAVAARFGVRRCVVVSAALAWYARRVSTRAAGLRGSSSSRAPP